MTEDERRLVKVLLIRCCVQNARKMASMLSERSCHASAFEIVGFTDPGDQTALISPHQARTPSLGVRANKMISD